MKRILLLAFLLVAVVAVGLLLYLGSGRLDSLVARTIETYGTRIVGTAVRVAGVELELREGRGTIRGLRVANPEGFSGGDAFTFDTIVLDLDTGTLRSQPVVIDALTVSRPQADFEVDGRGRSNFQVLKANVDAYSAAGAPPPPGAEDEAAVTRLRIRRFVLEEGQLEADVSALDPDREPYTTGLPAVRLEDLGGAGGATPGAIGKDVLSAFTDQVVRTAAASGAQRVLEEELGGETGRAAGELLRRVLE